MELLREFAVAFIPLFVAIDVAGVIPFFVSVTEGMPVRERRRVAVQAVVTATLVAIFFTALGKGVLHVLGVTLADFKIAGGLLLLALAVLDIAAPEKERRRPSPTVGVVPLGLPLIVGPAVLAALLIQLDLHGPVITVCALMGNMLVVWLGFCGSSAIIRIAGEAGVKAVSKVTSVILAAFGVMMVRVGILEIAAGLRG